MLRRFSHRAVVPVQLAAVRACSSQPPEKPSPGDKKDSPSTQPPKNPAPQQPPRKVATRQKKTDDEDEPEDPTPQRIRRGVVGVIVVAGVLYVWSWPSGELVSWDWLLDHADQIASITVYHSYAQVALKDGTRIHAGFPHDRYAAVRIENLRSKNGKISVHFIGTSWSELFLVWIERIAWLAPFLFVPLFTLSLLRAVSANSQGGVGRGTKKSFFQLQKKVNTSFKDVAGLHEAKQEIQEFVEFLKKPERFAKLGAKVPSGALILGPPGTGKTLLAKAVAGEADTAFISACGSDFVEMYVGMGALRVRQLFELARKQTRCIIFIDELDSIGMARAGGDQGSAREQENTLNELLAQLDGFQTRTGQVLVLASTNAPLDKLDKALVRPGRFDRVINVDKPSISERKEIFKVHLSNIKLAEDQPMPTILDRMSGLCPGFVGADIANICNEGAILAARENCSEVALDHLERSVDRVIGGVEKRSMVLSQFEKEVLAYHEAGHAVVGWFLKNADQLMKVSIVPRAGSALGYAQYLPHEGFISSPGKLLDSICVTLGGRVSEEIFYKHLSTGASDDLQKVTRMAYAYVSSYNTTAYPPPGYGDSVYRKPYSDDTADKLDREAKRLVDAAHKKTVDLLTKHRKEVELLAAHLLQNEVLTRQQISELLSPSPRLAPVETPGNEPVKHTPRHVGTSEDTVGVVVPNVPREDFPTPPQPVSA